MLNFEIQIGCPPCVDVITFELLQRFESLEIIYIEPESSITIHNVDITLAYYLDNHHQIMQKNVFHICKFNESMHRFQQKT
jgi:hypothetical protein